MPIGTSLCWKKQAMLKAITLIQGFGLAKAIAKKSVAGASALPAKAEKWMAFINTRYVNPAGSPQAYKATSAPRFISA